MQTQRVEQTRTANCCEIDGRTWVRMGSTAKCSIPPGQRPPSGAHVVTPDQRKPGYKIAWVFLGALAAIVASPWIAKALGCAVVALPLWVLR